ncbi:protein FAR1-RELATED SEQUENCE 5-like [Salvia splendens]|nr:protein FAR1-RELATED SEQUENCE 5-like [Salvia splendens]
MVIPECKDGLKPVVGMVFKSIEDARSFYAEYARDAGFETRKFSHKASGDVFTWLYMVCSREGIKRTREFDAVNARQGFANRRRRGSKRCGCNAKLTFKFVSEGGVAWYVVHYFIEEHNHSMVEDQHKRYMKSNRRLDQLHSKFIDDCMKANIGPTMTFNLLREVLGGYDSVGCTVTDIRNCVRDMKEHLKEVDAQLILNKMSKKKESCPGFHYVFEVDSNNKLTRYCMIFGPFTGKDNHGCPVTFAAGFLSNESNESFSWLFKQLVECMGVAPKMIITYQDRGMRLAIELVLPDTRHRWCMWHIMLKLADKVPKQLHADESFKKDLNACVWSELLEPAEFEESWNNVITQYGLENVPWFKTMFEDRTFWIPAYFRDFPMASLLKTTSISEAENSFFKRYSKPQFYFAEFVMQYDKALDAQRNKSERLDYFDSTIVPILATELPFEEHAATIYTDKMFKDVQAEIVEAYHSCNMVDMSVQSSNKVYRVSDGSRNTFNVNHEVGAEQIPEQYFGSRWLKRPLLKAVHGFPRHEFEMTGAPEVDAKRNAITKMHKTYYRLAQKAESHINDVNALITGMERLGLELFGDEGLEVPSLDKGKRIENVFGDPIPDAINVRPPDTVHTKGSGSRKVSRKEGAIRQMHKPLRRCKKCRELVRHDSRNCGKEKEKNKNK